MREGRNGGKLKSGNDGKGGRPRKLPELNKLMADILGDEKNGLTTAERILKAIEAKALKGDIKAAEMLLDRGYGKPAQAIIGGSEDDPAIKTLNEIIIRAVDATRPPEEGS